MSMERMRMTVKNERRRVTQLLPVWCVVGLGLLSSEASAQSSARSRLAIGTERGVTSDPQRRPWCVRTSSAPEETAASSSSRFAVTPLAILLTSAAPGTWSPFGP